MLEYQTLRLLLDPEAYRVYGKYVKREALSPPAQLLWDVLSKGAPVESVHPDDLAFWASTLYPNWDADKLAVFDTGLTQLKKQVSSSAGAEVVATWAARESAARVAELSDKFIESPSQYDYQALLGLEYERLRAEKSSLIPPTEDDLKASFKDTLSALAVGSDVRWRMGWLNQVVGSPYPGLFIVLGGRPESGKTTVLVSELGYMAPQLEEGGIIALFNNESHGRVLRLRVMQSVIGWTTERIKGDIKGAQSQYDKLMKGRDILIRDVHNESVSDVEVVLQQYGDRIKFIAFDQAMKLAGHESKADNSASRLEKLAGTLRGWATQYAPVLTTQWADATAEGQEYIDMNQLHNSKTGIVGEADTIINVGYSHEPQDEGLRYINVPKNKSLGCQNESLRHSRWVIGLDGARARATEKIR